MLLGTVGRCAGSQPRSPSLPQSSTHSKPLQPLHYLLQGLLGMGTVGFCPAGWSGKAAQLARTQGQGLLREGGKPPCMAVFMDLAHGSLPTAHFCPRAAPANTQTSPLFTPTALEPPRYGYLTAATHLAAAHSQPHVSPPPREGDSPHFTRRDLPNAPDTVAVGL